MRRIALSLCLVMFCSQLALFSADIFTVAGLGTVAQVQQAINSGADVNARDGNEFTPLMAAAATNTNPEVLSVLIKAGTDMNAKDEWGETAFDYAKDNPAIKGTKAYWELNDARFK